MKEKQPSYLLRSKETGVIFKVYKEKGNVCYLRSEDGTKRVITTRKKINEHYEFAGFVD